MKKRKAWRIAIIIIVIIAITIGIAQCAKKKTAAALKKMTSKTEESYKVKRGKIVSNIEITGEIQPQVTVQIKSKVSGKVVKFYVDENDYVKSGQKIADIEPDYNQASTLSAIQSRLKIAEIRLKNAEKDSNDKALLFSQNSISEKELTTARDELTTAQLEFRQAQQQYDLVKELDTGKAVTPVYATASGTVIQRAIQEGEMITSSNSTYGEGSVLVKVADLSKMVVKANINEVDIAKFKKGQNAIVKVDALPYEEFTGKITKIAPMATTVNNAIVFPVEISLDKPGSMLKPGMTGNISIIGETRENVLIIPIRAVFTDDKNQDIVYLYKDTAVKATARKDDTKLPQAPAKPIATPVKLGSNDLQMVEVVEGLKEGDKISLTEPGGGSGTDFFTGGF
jgi:HlyD family secretion protein